MFTITTASGLVYEELAVGKGAEASPGQQVTVHYKTCVACPEWRGYLIFEYAVGASM